MTPQALTYFTDRNISVEFNVLGKNNDLRTAYINATKAIVSTTDLKLSHHVKHACYNQFYTFNPRAKLTGFEAFKAAEKQFKLAVCTQITAPLFAPCEIMEAALGGQSNYKTSLLQSLDDYNKPILLYLSGGLDSEFAAKALIEAGKMFTPVIFKWTDALGVTKNDEETQFAFDFCALNNLQPLVRTIDIETLWASSEFKQFAIDIQTLSPHLSTHAWMVKLMDAEVTSAFHLFGGEVRYITNYVTDTLQPANLVYLSKVAAGFSGSYYSSVDSNSNDVTLNFFMDGSWSITGFGLDPFGPTTGTWATPPLAASWQYRWASFAIKQTGGTGITIPAAGLTAPSPWVAMNGGVIARTAVGANGNAILAGVFEIRSTANPAIVASYAVDFESAS